MNNTIQAILSDGCGNEVKREKNVGVVAIEEFNPTYEGYSLRHENVDDKSFSVEKVVKADGNTDFNVYMKAGDSFIFEADDYHNFKWRWIDEKGVSQEASGYYQRETFKTHAEIGSVTITMENDLGCESESHITIYLNYLGKIGGNQPSDAIKICPYSVLTKNIVDSHFSDATYPDEPTAKPTYTYKYSGANNAGGVLRCDKDFNDSLIITAPIYIYILSVLRFSQLKTALR